VPTPGTPSPHVRRTRLSERLIAGVLGVVVRLLPRLPVAVVLALADVVATVIWLFDFPGRSVGRQNLEVAFGAALTPSRRRRVLWDSYRNAVRVESLLFHLQPLPPARFARWVDFPAAEAARLRSLAEAGRRAVFVSAHLGNWELLLAMRTAVPFSPDFAYMAETANSRALDEVVERLRDRGQGGPSPRKRGALALRSALAQGKCVSLMMDRNVRGQLGGDYVPFLGLPARTTPLGARLALAFGVDLVAVALLPDRPRHWRFVISPPLMPPPSGDAEADGREGLRRANEWLGDAIRRHPEAYLWTLKRWKSRPTEEQGRYPAYSFHDPA
jgi:KDO2-lipid IV(A) lauroyltransferase